MRPLSAQRPSDARQPSEPAADAATHQSVPAQPARLAGDSAVASCGSSPRGIVGLSSSYEDLARAGRLMALIERDLPSATV